MKKLLAALIATIALATNLNAAETSPTNGVNQKEGKTMYTAAYVFKRLPGMSLYDFLEYYEKVHGPRMVELLKDKGLVSYEHYPVRPVNAGDLYVPEAGAAYDAISIYMFESPEVARDAWVVPELVEDSKNFIDFDSMVMMPLNKRVVFP